MIQEVVGTRVGRYFLPAFAGVAFSNNEFRWSPRIKREDGLRAPGAGPRHARRRPRRRRLPDPRRPRAARAAGQRHAGRDPALRPAEDRRHQPRDAALRDDRRGRAARASTGASYPRSTRSCRSTTARASTAPSAFGWDPAESHTVVTFDGLISSTPFMARMRTLLKLLRERIGSPVDIEFASDGRDLYLLQCRPQSFSQDAVAVADPARPAGRTRAVLGQPLRVERPRPRHHPRRLRGSRAVRPAREPHRAAGRRARGRPAEQAAARSGSSS